MVAIQGGASANRPEADWKSGLLLSLVVLVPSLLLSHAIGKNFPLGPLAILIGCAVAARYHWAPPLVVFLAPLAMDVAGQWWPVLGSVLPTVSTLESGLAFASVYILAIVVTHHYFRRMRAHVELQTLFNTVFQQANDGIVMFDGASRAIDCNPRACELLGRSRNEIVGASSSQLLEGWHAGTADQPRVFPSRPREGGETWMEASIQRLPDKLALGILRDITPQRLAEVENQRQIQWRQAVIDALPMEIAVIDRQGVIRMVNRAWRLFGRETNMPLRNDGVGWNYLEVCERAIEPDQAESLCVAEGLRGVLEAKRNSFSRVYYCPGAGRKLWFEMVAAALPDGAAIVHLDITSQLRIQEQLRTANSHLRTVIDCSPVAIITFSAQGQVLSWNRGAERIFGWTEEEAVGRPLPGLFPNQEPDCVGRLLEQAAQPNSEAMEVQRPHKDGRKLEIRLWTRRIPTAEDQPDHYLTVAEDITEARRVEEQLRHALKMEAMGRLAGGVAHDFSNLLTVLLGFGGLLEQKLPADAPGGREAREMLLAAERASALTAQLLAFSRRQMRKSRPVYVNQLIGNIERMLRRLIGEDIELAIELTPELAPVLADAQDIELAIVNLAVNARDAMPNGGRLEIITRPAEAFREGLDPSTRWIEIVVSDSGEGIRDEVRPFLFEPFFTTKEFGRGTGLGLANVRDVLQRAGGEIRVTSKLGRGSTFRLLLPAAESVPDLGPERTERTERKQSRQEQIWVVEDDHAVRDLVVGILQSAGYRTRAVGDPDEPIQWAQESTGAPDLLLTDVVLPGSNGTELAKRLRGFWPGLRVLYVSGYPHEVLARHGVFEDDVQFLAKPFSTELLLDRIREILNRAEIPVD